MSENVKSFTDGFLHIPYIPISTTACVHFSLFTFKNLVMLWYKLPPPRVSTVLTDLLKSITTGSKNSIPKQAENGGNKSRSCNNGYTLHYASYSSCSVNGLIEGETSRPSPPVELNQILAA